MKAIAACSALIAVTTFFRSTCNAAENENHFAEAKPLIVISGADSHVKKQSYQRIASPADWARVWASHQGTTVGDASGRVMEVDFSRCVVVVIFRGGRINVGGIKINSLSETANSTIIRFTEVTYQTAGASNNEPPRRPYAFVVIPKTNKRIVLQEDKANIIVETWLNTPFAAAPRYIRRNRQLDELGS